MERTENATSGALQAAKAIWFMYICVSDKEVKDWPGSAEIEAIINQHIPPDHSRLAKRVKRLEEALSRLRYAGNDILFSDYPSDEDLSELKNAIINANAVLLEGKQS